MAYIRGEPLLDSCELRFCRNLAKEYNRSEDEIVELFKLNKDQYPNWDTFELTTDDLQRIITRERGILN